MRLAIAALGALALLGGCRASDLPEERERNADVPESLRAEKLAATAGDLAGVTPMAERVAVLGLLNKRNGLTRDLELKPGEARRVGDVVVQLRACETTPPWESPPETGAFVRIFVADREGKMARVFSGWLFQKRPERNIIEHAVYDVYVKSCAMSFPGVPAPAPATASSAAKSASANGDEGGSAAPAGGDEAPDNAQ